MKKLLMALVLLPLMALADMWTDESTGYTWYYNVSGGKAEIRSYSVLPKPSCALEIPSQINGYPVVSIGDDAFRYCSWLTSVTIPSSVTSIGYEAFYGCNGLTRVNISDLAAWCEIDFYDESSNPLYYAGKLYLNGVEVTGSLVIPDGVESIGDYAFYGCRRLTSVAIPSTVTYIASSVFSGCKSLSAIQVDPANRYYTSVDGVLYGKGMYKLWICPEGYWGTLVIPASVTSVSSCDLSACSRMTSITLEDGNQTFCLKNGLLCSRDGKTVMACPGGMTDLVFPDGVTAVYSDAFSGCSELQRLTIPGSVVTVPDRAFEGCCSLKDVVVQGGVTRIGSSAFRGCSGLESITLPFIGTQRGCGERFYSIFGYSGDIPETLTTVTLTDETTIPNYAFDGCKHIRTIILPIGVSSIGDSAFRGCESLNAISLPAGIAKIGSSAFYGCSSLSEVVIPVGVSSVESSTFYDCTSLRKVTLPVGLTEIGDSAFRNCRNLSQVNVPNTVSSIGEDAFSSCVGLGAGVVIVNDCLLTVNPFDSWSGTGGDVVIPSSVRLYANGPLFNGVGDLTSIVVNAGPKEIPEFFFAGCSNLKSVVINPGVKVIGGGAFSRCVRLENVQLPEGLESVGGSAFEGCVAMESLAIPSSVVEFGGLPSSFFWVDSWVGGGWWGIVEGAGTPKFKTVTVAAGNKMFATYNGLLYSKDGKTLYGCPSGLRAVTIRKGTKTIKADAFRGCSLLETIEIPEGVVPEMVHVDDAWGFSYDYEAAIDFWGCSSLKSVSVPSTLTEFAMPDSPVLSSLKVASGNPKYVSSGNVLYLKKQLGTPFNAGKVLVGCPRGLRAPVVADDTKNIATAAFEGCALIEKLILPASVERIGQRPFVGCKRLKTVEYGGHAPLPYHDQAWEQDGWTGSAMSPDINSWGEVHDEQMAEQIREDWGLYAYAVTNVWVEDEDYTQSCGGGYYVEENVLLSVESHVLKGTKGWGDSDEWQGRPLVYVGSAPAALTYYSVEFDPCGGECECVLREVAKGKSVGTLPTPILSRHKFLGWYTAVEGGTKISSTTKVTAAVTYYAHWQYDGLALVSAKVVADCAGMGTVSGGKRAKAGTKVTLKATAGKGYAFAGWYLGGELVSKSASYSFKATGEDADYRARFVTLAEDKASVVAAVKGLAFAAGGANKVTSLATNVMCGVALSWPLSHGALSATSVKVTGLPKGLKYDTKKKAIIGVPTAPGKTSSVKIAVTTAGKQKVTFTLKVKVVALPEWAKGQFKGTVDGNALTMSVGSTGKISGKFKQGATNWTFSASSFTVASQTAAEPLALVCSATAKGSYTVGSGKSKKTKSVTTPISFALMADPATSPIAAEGLGDFAGGTDNVVIWRVAGVRLSVNTSKGGTVKMDKSYGQVASGKSVKLTAKLSKGYAFLGWYDTVTGARISQATSYSLKMSGADRFVEARFAKESALAAPVLDWNAATEFPVGVSYSAKPKVSCEAAVKIVKVTGLPAGLSYKSGKVSGAPTAVKTYTVSVTVALATNAKKTWTLKQKLVVGVLPAWAKGTFNGGSETTPMQATLTIGSTGKVSGKLCFANAVWTLSGAHYTKLDPEAKTATLSLTAKKGTTKKTVAVTVYEGQFQGFAFSETKGFAFEAQQNLWKSDDFMAGFLKDWAAQMPGKEYPDLADDLTVKFGQDGTVTAKLKVGKNTFSATTVFSLTAIGEATVSGKLYLYFAPNAKKKFKGAVRVVEFQSWYP